MSPFTNVGAALLIAYVAMVALIDLRTRRIPNALSATAAVLGLGLHAWVSGAPGVVGALAGAAVGLGIFLPFYVLRAFGAGDVKAMGTVGIFLGAQGTLLAVAFTLVAGAIVGLIRSTASQPRRFAYGGAIAIGTLATVLMSSAGRASF